MRVLVISDVHGNLAALDSVLTVPHDQVVCLGDLVGYGPHPAACVERLRAIGACVIQGNHDRAVGEGAATGCRPEFARLAEAAAPIAHAHLSPYARAYLGALPDWAFLQIAGRRFMFVHGTPKNPIYEYLGPDAEAWAHQLASIDADVVLAGHTHLQFELPIGRKRVVNPGSVGQPKDDDPRAAYAIIEGGCITPGRVAYPVEETVGALRSSGVDDDAVEPLVELLRTGRVPPSPRSAPRDGTPDPTRHHNVAREP